MFLESLPIDGITNIVDAGVLNQWNTLIIRVPANTLKTVGEWIEIDAYGSLATNADTKAVQLWATNTKADIGGSGANLSASGTNLSNSTSSSTNAGGIGINFTGCIIMKTGSNTQISFCWLGIGTGAGGITANACLAPTLTDTQDIFIGLGFANQSNPAASVVKAALMVKQIVRHS